MKTYTRTSLQTGLTDSDIIDLRIDAQHMNSIALGEKYGIDRTTAARIASNRTWTHVPAPVKQGKYLVYPDGRIYSTANKRFLTVTVGKDGMGYVEITRQRKPKYLGTQRVRVSVASMVAQAFLGSKSSKLTFLNGRADDAHFTNIAITS